MNRVVWSWRLRRTARLLRKGGVIAYPTEAVWGLGCNPFDLGAVERILSIKRRPQHKGLIVIAPTLDCLAPLLKPLPSPLQQDFQTLYRKSINSARPTTWLLPNNNYFPDWITGSSTDIAVRVTLHPIAAALAKCANGYLVSTSANPATLQPARSVAEAKRYFGASVDAYIDGPLGHSTSPSSIVRVVDGEQLR